MVPPVPLQDLSQLLVLLHHLNPPSQNSIFGPRTGCHLHQFSIPQRQLDRLQFLLVIQESDIFEEVLGELPLVTFVPGDDICSFTSHHLLEVRVVESPHEHSHHHFPVPHDIPDELFGDHAEIEVVVERLLDLEVGEFSTEGYSESEQEYSKGQQFHKQVIMGGCGGYYRLQTERYTNQQLRYVCLIHYLWILSSHRHLENILMSITTDLNFILSETHLQQRHSILKAQELSLDKMIEIETERIQMLESQIEHVQRRHRLVVEASIGELQAESNGMIEETEKELVMIRGEWEGRLEAVLNSFSVIEDVVGVKGYEGAKERMGELTRENEREIRRINDTLNQEIEEEYLFIQTLKHSYSTHTYLDRKQQNSSLINQPINLPQYPNLNPSSPPNRKHQMQSKLREIHRYKSKIDQLKRQLTESSQQQGILKLRKYQQKIQKTMRQFQTLKTIQTLHQ